MSENFEDGSPSLWGPQNKEKRKALREATKTLQKGGAVADPELRSLALRDLQRKERRKQQYQEKKQVLQQERLQHKKQMQAAKEQERQQQLKDHPLWAMVTKASHLDEES